MPPAPPAGVPPSSRRAGLSRRRRRQSPQAGPRHRRDIGISESSLRDWLAQADIDEGRKEGMSSLGLNVAEVGHAPTHGLDRCSVADKALKPDDSEALTAGPSESLTGVTNPNVPCSLARLENQCAGVTPTASGPIIGARSIHARPLHQAKLLRRRRTRQRDPGLKPVDCPLRAPAAAQLRPWPRSGRRQAVRSP